MSNDFKPLGFAQWVNRNGKALCEEYDRFLKETGVDPFDVSILDFEEEMYRETHHFLYTEEVDNNVYNILVANGGLA